MLLVGYVHDHSNMKSMNTLSMIVKRSWHNKCQCWNAQLYNHHSWQALSKDLLTERMSSRMSKLVGLQPHLSSTHIPYLKFHWKISGRGECWSEWRECLTFPITSPAWYCLTWSQKNLGFAKCYVFWCLGLKMFQSHDLIFQVWCMKEGK